MDKKHIDDMGLPTDNFRKFINNIIFASKHMPEGLLDGSDERIQMFAIAAHLAEGKKPTEEKDD